MARHRLFAIAAALFLTGLLSGCSPAPPPPSPAPKAVDPTAPGMVWRVSGGKAAFFLAGSFHLLRATDYPLPAPYETAWTETRHLVMEIAPGDASSATTQAQLLPLITLRDRTLQSLVSADTWNELSRWAQLTSTPLAQLQTMPAWMAGLTVAVNTSSQLGFRNDQGIERHFLSRLQTSGKTSEGLETVLGQMSLFSQFPASTHEAMLQQSLAEASQLSNKINTLIQAWRQGDTSAMHALMAKSFADFPQVRRLLLDDRNGTWMPRLEALLQSSTPTMVLVGTAHLCGPGSLIELLQKKGYQCLHVPAPVTAVKKTA